MKRYNATAFLKFDSALNGNAFVNGNVTVYLAGTTTKAGLFSDTEGVTPRDNPVKTDSNGQYWFYINPVNVDIVINEGNPGTNTIFDEPMLDDVSIDVKSFGALGDGVTDDSTAIQAALDFANSLGGGTVRFPNGTYVIGTTLVVGMFIRCVGTSYAGTGCVLKYTSTSAGTACVDIGVSDITFGGFSQLEYIRITLDTNNTIGVRLRTVQSATLRQVHIAGGSSANGGVGVLVWGGDSSCFLNLMEGVSCNGLESAFKFDADSGETTTNNFINCPIVNCITGYDFKRRQGNTVQVYGGNIENTTTAVKFPGDDIGTHTGVNNASVMTDTSATWGNQGLSGSTITNTTDGSSGVITANTTTTVTATLTGGTDNDWDTSDAYTISSGVQSTTFIAVRFESNTTDFDLGTGSIRNNFIGCQNFGVISDTSPLNKQNIFVNKGGFNDLLLSKPRGTFQATCFAIGEGNAFGGMITGGRKDCLSFGENNSTGIVDGISNVNLGNDVFGTADGSDNTVTGHGAMGSTTGTGIDRNTVYGAFAAEPTTGDSNTHIGMNAGRSNTTGNNNVTLGFGAGHTASPFVITTESSRIVLGNDSHTNAYIKIDWTITSDIRDKTDITDFDYGLDFILDLNPIKYKFDDRSRYEDGIPDGTKKDSMYQIGFSAQNVLEAEESQNPGVQKVIVDNSQPDNLRMISPRVIPALVNAIKELEARLKKAGL